MNLKSVRKQFAERTAVYLAGFNKFPYDKANAWDGKITLSPEDIPFEEIYENELEAWEQNRFKFDIKCSQCWHFVHYCKHNPFYETAEQIAARMPKRQIIILDENGEAIEKKRRVRNMGKKHELTPDEIALVVKMYKEGNSTTDLATHFKTFQPVISAALKNENVPVRKGKRSNGIKMPIDKRQVIDFYEQKKMGVAQIAKHFKTTSQPISAILRESGHVIKQGRPSTKSVLTDAQRQSIVMAAAKNNISSLMKRFGYDYKTIKDILDAAGVNASRKRKKLSAAHKAAMQAGRKNK